MSGESDKPRFDPNATIQLAAIEGLEGIELSDGAKKAAANLGSRSTPPPLPPETSAPAMTPSIAASPRSVGKTVAYAAMLVAVVGLAMAAGLTVGNRARAKFGTAAATSASVSQSSPTAATPASVSVRELTLPPIEIKGP